MSFREEHPEQTAKNTGPTGDCHHDGPASRPEIVSAPGNPAITAGQRRSPTFSPSSGPDRAQTQSGMVKEMAQAIKTMPLMRGVTGSDDFDVERGDAGDGAVEEVAALDRSHP